MRMSAIGLAVLALAPLAAWAQDQQARTWAAACAACHGPTGRSEGGMPSLAGHSARDLAEDMKAFREGRRPGTVMPQLMKGYSDQEIQQIAEVWAKGGVR